MSWLLNDLGRLAGLAAQEFIKIIGFVLTIILRALVNDLVLPLLNHTVFAPFSLHGTTAVATAFNVVWATAAAVSAGIALAMLSTGVFSRLALTWAGSKSWAEIGEGLAVWMAVLVGGRLFLGLLLSISNDATQALVQIMHTVATIALTHHVAAVGLTSAAAVVFTYFLWPLSGLALAALLVWCVGVWLMRQVDLVLFGGLLPVTAALGVGGNKAPFKWAWSEAMGAVFNQLAMAVVLWIGFLFLQGPAQSSILGQFKDILLAATAFTLAARAPQLLANLTGHRSAGASHLLAGVALGYLGGRGLETMARATPLGQAMSMAAQGAQERAKAQVTSWAGRPSLGERLQNTPVGQALSEKMGALGESLGQTRIGEKAHAFGQSSFGQMLGRGAQAAARPVQTAASFAYQPMATLGRSAARGVADSNPNGPAGTFAQSRDATIIAGEAGIGTAAGRLFGGGLPPEKGMEIYAHAQQADQLGHLMNAEVYQGFMDRSGQTIWKSARDVAAAAGNPQGLQGLTPMQGTDGQAVYQAQFASGSWQGALYQKTQTSVLKNIPMTRADSIYAVDPPIPTSSSGSARTAMYS